jgi:opacity protein-like surface antigen
VVGNHLRSTLLESEHKVSGLLNLGSSDARTGSYGAFVGYNVQFDEAVLGFEVDFTRARLSVSGSDQIARGLSTSNGFTNVVALTGQAEGELQDYGTLRARAGYTYGSFMPYVTAGLAIARTSLNQTVGVQTFGFDVAAQRQAVETFIDTGVVTPVPNYGYVPGSFDPLTGRGTPAAPVLLTSRKRSTVIGYAGGLGVDMALTPNFFLRGEYQFVHFNSFAGQALTINAIRGSAGIKF